MQNKELGCCFKLNQSFFYGGACHNSSLFSLEQTAFSSGFVRGQFWQQIKDKCFSENSFKPAVRIHPQVATSTHSNVACTNATILFLWHYVRGLCVGDFGGGVSLSSPPPFLPAASNHKQGSAVNKKELINTKHRCIGIIKLNHKKLLWIFSPCSHITSAKEQVLGEGFMSLTRHQGEHPDVLHFQKRLLLNNFFSKPSVEYLNRSVGKEGNKNLFWVW